MSQSHMSQSIIFFRLSVAPLNDGLLQPLAEVIDEGLELVGGEVGMMGLEPGGEDIEGFHLCHGLSGLQTAGIGGVGQQRPIKITVTHGLFRVILVQKYIFSLIFSQSFERKKYLCAK